MNKSDILAIIERRMKKKEAIFSNAELSQATRSCAAGAWEELCCMKYEIEQFSKKEGHAA